MKLTDLEKAALLIKSGIAPNLINARDIRLQEMNGVYDPNQSREGNWCDNSEEDEMGWHYGFNYVYRVSLNNQQFVILKKENMFEYNQNFSPSRSNYHSDCNFCGTFYYVFRSEGPELDAQRINREILEKLLTSAKKHLPEALEMFRDEYSLYIPKNKTINY